MLQGVCMVLWSPGMALPLWDSASGDSLSRTGSGLLLQPALQFCHCPNFPHHAVCTSGLPPLCLVWNQCVIWMFDIQFVVVKTCNFVTTGRLKLMVPCEWSLQCFACCVLSACWFCATCSVWHTNQGSASSASSAYHHSHASVRHHVPARPDDILCQNSRTHTYTTPNCWLNVGKVNQLDIFQSYAEQV